MLTRSYTELVRYSTLEDRFDYLKLGAQVGESTFGFDRYINQAFYRSTQWKHIRNHVIARDRGLDLGVEGYEVHDRVIIHHMNPMGVEDIVDGDESILDPEYLIMTTHRTHSAIHYGDKRLLTPKLVARTPGDTRLW